MTLRMKPYTILVPYDRSDGAAEMLRLACQIAVMKGRPAVVRIVTDALPAMALYDWPAFINENSEHAVVHAVAITSQFDVKTESHVRLTYDPAKTIVEHDDLSHSDTIFFATKPPTFFPTSTTPQSRCQVGFPPCPLPGSLRPRAIPYCLAATDVIAEADRIVSLIA
ncbi:MAG: hypothetical protein NVSMB22_19020 [Chloroflexota bacterium]